MTILGSGQSTPAPWINVVANPAFGFQVAAEGGGYTWSVNSRENQLTPWSNDPVTDRPGEAFYLRDDDAATCGARPPCRSATRPRTTSPVTARGYSRFEHAAHGIALDLLQFVPLDDPIKISRLTLRNTSSRTRRLSVTAYVEWVLGPSRSASAPFVATEIDPGPARCSRAMPGTQAFGSRVAFADLGGTANRLDRRPAGVHRPQRHAREPRGARRRDRALQDASEPASIPAARCGPPSRLPAARNRRGRVLARAGGERGRRAEPDRALSRGRSRRRSVRCRAGIGTTCSARSR